MIEMESLSRKYATALMEHYNWQTKDVVWIQRLGGVAQFLREHRQRFVYAPRALYATVLEVFGFHEPDFQSLLFLLEQQQRLLLFSEILYRVVDLYKKIHGIEYCHIASASHLTDAQSKEIKQLLEHASGKKLLCFYETDPSLIAGIRARSETFVWEDSIEQRLRALERI